MKENCQYIYPSESLLQYPTAGDQSLPSDLSKSQGPAWTRVSEPGKHHPSLPRSPPQTAEAPKRVSLPRRMGLLSHPWANQLQLSGMNPGPDTSDVAESLWSNSQPKGTTSTPWSSNVSLILSVFTLCQPQWRLVHVGLHLNFTQELFPQILHYFTTSVTLSVNVFTPTLKTLCVVPCRLHSFQRMGSLKSNEICLLKSHIYKVICDTGAYLLTYPSFYLLLLYPHLSLPLQRTKMSLTI